MGKVSTVEPVKALTFTSADYDRAVYADVAMSARLRELALADSEFSAKIDILRLAETRSEEVVHSFGGECVDFNFDTNSGIAVGHYTWSADVKHHRTKVLKLRCKYLLVYSNLKGFEFNYVRLYFSTVGKFSTYPYFRAVFASHTSFAGLAVRPLPSLTERID